MRGGRLSIPMIGTLLNNKDIFIADRKSMLARTLIHTNKNCERIVDKKETVAAEGFTASFLSLGYNEA